MFSRRPSSQSLHQVPVGLVFEERLDLGEVLHGQPEYFFYCSGTRVRARFAC
jgi:hypothetical protein